LKHINISGAHLLYASHLNDGPISKVAIRIISNHVITEESSQLCAKDSYKTAQAYYDLVIETPPTTCSSSLPLFSHRGQLGRVPISRCPQIDGELCLRLWPRRSARKAGFLASVPIISLFVSLLEDSSSCESFLGSPCSLSSSLLFLALASCR
jgi:hypothetical protein